MHDKILCFNSLGSTQTQFKLKILKLKLKFNKIWSTFYLIVSHTCTIYVNERRDSAIHWKQDWYMYKFLKMWFKKLCLSNNQIRVICVCMHENYLLSKRFKYMWSEVYDVAKHYYYWISLCIFKFIIIIVECLSWHTLFIRKKSIWLWNFFDWGRKKL